jgi:hypothetical protein
VPVVRQKLHLSSCADLRDRLSQTLQKTALNFQAALQAAGALQNQRTVPYNLKANGGPNDGRIAITIPALFGDSGGNGYMAIYIRRQGSIALANDNPTISLSDVFDNQALPNRQCNPFTIASAGCNTNNDSLRSALLKLLKGVGGTAFDAPTVNQLIVDSTSSDRAKSIYETCKALRTISRVNMHLSTIDEMIIRWAATKEGRLQEALKDDAQSKALAQENKVSVSELQDMCWNDGDEKTLNGVATFLKKTIEK